MTQISSNHARVRQIVFLLLCIGVRLGISFLSKHSLSQTPVSTASILIRYGLIGLSIAISTSLMFHYFAGTRQIAFEAGGKVWWNYLRPLHGVLFGLFAILACRGEQHAWILLLVDTIVGFFAWHKQRIMCTMCT